MILIAPMRIQARGWAGRGGDPYSMVRGVLTSRPEEGEEAFTSWEPRSLTGPAASHPPQPRLGHRLPVRPDHQLQDLEAAQHHRRVHQGGPGHHRRPLHHLGRHRQRARRHRQQTG
jgi:hypothetical protein